MHGVVQPGTYCALIRVHGEEIAGVDFCNQLLSSTAY